MGVRVFRIVERGVAIETIIAVFTARTLIVALNAAVGDDTEIVICELQVIFRLHAVAVERRVMRQFPVLLQHLRRVTASPAVDPVTLVAATLAAIAATAAT